VADAPALAAAAVTRHDIGGLSGDGAAMLGQAFAGGFSLAMLWAGAAALLAAGLLVALRGRRRAGANHPVVESLGPME
jgi:hypothetical protein